MKEILSNKKFWKVITIFFLVISIALILIYIISKPIHVDEGWYHSIARGKNIYGYYTFTPFYDIPSLDNIYTLHRDLPTQLFRLTDLLFKSPITAIKSLRLLFLILWSIAIWLYLKQKKIFENRWDNILIIMVIMLHPVMLSAFGKARPEIAISALLLLLFWNYYRSIESNYKTIVLLFISSLIFFSHLNGILYLLVLMIVGIEIKSPMKTLKLWVLGAGVILLYYLIFFDANAPLQSQQFKLMYSTGAEEKFISSINSFLDYIWREIRDRYILWGRWRSTKYYPVFLISIIVPLFAGIYADFKNKIFKVELIYILATMFFFVFLGNKTILYWAYIIPLLIIMSFSLLRENVKTIRMISLILILVYSFIAFRASVHQSKNNEITKIIVKTIYKEVKYGETVYAPLHFEPYLSSKYNYLTTTQKDKNNFYEMFDIHPDSCYILAKPNDGIWKAIQSKSKILVHFDNNMILKMVEPK